MSALLPENDSEYTATAKHPVLTDGWALNMFFSVTMFFFFFFHFQFVTFYLASPQLSMCEHFRQLSAVHLSSSLCLYNFWMVVLSTSSNSPYKRFGCALNKQAFRFCFTNILMLTNVWLLRTWASSNDIPPFIGSKRFISRQESKLQKVLKEKCSGKANLESCCSFWGHAFSKKYKLFVSLKYFECWSLIIYYLGQKSSR